MDMSCSVMLTALKGFMRFFKVFLIMTVVVFAPKFVFAGQSFSFKGQVDLQAHEFDIVVSLDEKGSISVKAKRLSEASYRFSLDLNHLKTPLFDLLSKVESSVDLVKRKNGGKTNGKTAFQGKIWSQYSLVDYKPINELSSRFEVKDEKLHVMALSVGNLTCEGYIGLTAPYDLDVTVNLAGVGMSDFLNFWGSGKDDESSGVIFGEIKAAGSLEQLILRGNLESKNGFVQELDYAAIVLNIEGTYPLMQIAQSTISQSDGVSFSLEGSFDLSDKENFKKQISALTLAPLVSDSGSELEWTIMRINPKASGMTEFKYQLQKRDVLGTGPSSGGEIDMLGIERTRKF